MGKVKDLMKDKKFLVFVGVIILMFAALAILDYMQYPQAFWWHGITWALLISVLYYFAIKPDLSEAGSLFLAFLVLLYTGLEDILFYIFGAIVGKPIPASMEHLTKHEVIGTLSSWLGYSTVTFESLAICVAIGGLIAFGILIVGRRIK